VVRAASIGCLAAAALLDAGARPASVVMVAPVRAETIARHAAREREGAFLGGLVAPFLLRPLDVDLVATLSRTATDALIVLPTRDVYLPEDEAQLLVRAAGRASAVRVVRVRGSHQAAVLRAWGFTLDEERFAGRLTPQLLPAELELLERVRPTGGPARDGACGADR
jgi:hypothetical protein